MLLRRAAAYARRDMLLRRTAAYGARAMLQRRTAAYARRDTRTVLRRSHSATRWRRASV